MKRVSRHILAKIIMPISCPPDEEWEELMKMDCSDPGQLADLIRQRIKPHFLGYDEASRQKIRDSMDYFLSLEDSLLERVFPAYQVPIEPVGVARSFFSLSYKEFFGVSPVSELDRSGYCIDDSEEFANSLYWMKT